jgi:hypothetical protein
VKLPVTQLIIMLRRTLPSGVSFRVYKTQILLNVFELKTHELYMLQEQKLCQDNVCIASVQTENNTSIGKCQKMKLVENKLEM